MGKLEVGQWKEQAPLSAAIRAFDLALPRLQ